MYFWPNLKLHFCISKWPQIKKLFCKMFLKLNFTSKYMWGKIPGAKFHFHKNLIVRYSLCSTDSSWSWKAGHNFIKFCLMVRVLDQCFHWTAHPILLQYLLLFFQPLPFLPLPTCSLNSQSWDAIVQILWLEVQLCLSCSVFAVPLDRQSLNMSVILNVKGCASIMSGSYQI